MMSVKDINKKEVISSVEDYISWHKQRASTSPFSEVRYKKAEQILAIVKNEPDNEGYHDDMVQAIYNLYRECVEEVSGCKRSGTGMSFSDAFYYIYHVLIDVERMESKIKQYAPNILHSYSNYPEESMKNVLDVVIGVKANTEISDYQKREALNALSDILRYLMKFI